MLLSIYFAVVVFGQPFERVWCVELFFWLFTVFSIPAEWQNWYRGMQHLPWLLHHRLPITRTAPSFRTPTWTMPPSAFSNPISLRMSGTYSCLNSIFWFSNSNIVWAFLSHFFLLSYCEKERKESQIDVETNVLSI